MSVHLSEEEQIENFKRWWKDNGKVVVMASAFAVLSYFAYTVWQDKKLAKAQAASAQFESLSKLMTVQPGKTLSDVDKTTAEHIATELKEKNSGSLYANAAAMYLAKLAVEAGNLDKAVTELKWVLASKPDVGTEQLAKLRLARLYVAKAAYSDAQALLTGEPIKAFASDYAEVNGDILKAQGNKAAALTAYQKALKENDNQSQERGMVLQLKIDELKSPEVASEEKAQ